MRTSTKFSMIVFPLFFILYLLPQSSLRKGFTIVLALVTAIGLIYFWYKERNDYKGGNNLQISKT